MDKNIMCRDPEIKVVKISIDRSSENPEILKLDLFEIP